MVCLQMALCTIIIMQSAIFYICWPIGMLWMGAVEKCLPTKHTFDVNQPSAYLPTNAALTCAAKHKCNST